MAQHKALGRGLNALFSAQAPAKGREAAAPAREDASPDVREIAVAHIRPNRHQPRTQFDPAALEELALSIRTHGVAQPLVVTKAPEADQYELVVGERRLRAAKLAGLETVPCLVRTFSNRQRFEVALVENIQRQDLNGLEEAVALAGLMREYGLTQEQAALAIGKSRSAVANTLRFLRLHEDVQGALREGRISEGHAKVLAGLSEHAEQLRWLEKIETEKLTVRDLEHGLAPKAPKKKKSAGNGATAKSPDIARYEEDIQRVLGRRVDIQTDGKKGWIRFAFYSPWDLEMLLKKLELFPGGSEAGSDGESSPT